MPEFFEAVRYILVGEGSLAAREEKLKRENLLEKTISVPALSTLEEKSEGVFFSNELVDAFPVRRVVFRKDCWKEFYVAVGPEDEFAWGGKRY